MKSQEVEFNDGRKTEATFFDVPMMHEDWHEAEKAGLKYAGYLWNGPDYWDASMVFATPNKVKAAEEWLAEE